MTMLLFVATTTMLALLYIHLAPWYVRLELPGSNRNTHASPDSRYLAVAADDPTPIIYDLHNGRQLNRFADAKGHQGGITGVQFTADSATLITTGIDDMIRCWNMASGQIERVIPLNSGRFWEIFAISPNGRHAMCQSFWYSDDPPGNGHLTITVDIASGHARELDNDIWPCYAYSPDSTHVIYTVFVEPNNEYVISFDLISGEKQVLKERNTDESFIGRLAYRDGHRLAAMSRVNGEARVFDLDADNSYPVTAELAELFYPLRYSRGRYILDDYLHDYDTGDTLATFQIGSEWLAFLPNGRDIVCSNGGKGVFQIWSRRRPEYWWGIICLPELWLALVSIILLASSYRRDRQNFTPC